MYAGEAESSGRGLLAKDAAIVSQNIHQCTNTCTVTPLHRYINQQRLWAVLQFVTETEKLEIGLHGPMPQPPLHATHGRA